MNGWRGWLARRQQAARDARRLRITSDAAGIRVTRPRGSVAWSLAWSELAQVVAFKRDLFTVDDLCLGFRGRGGTEFHTLDEEMLGWDQLQPVLEQRLGIHFHEWFAQVAFPAFAANWTVLWPHPAEAGTPEENHTGAAAAPSLP